MTFRFTPTEVQVTVTYNPGQQLLSEEFVGYLAAVPAIDDLIREPSGLTLQVKSLEHNLDVNRRVRVLVGRIGAGAPFADLAAAQAFMAPIIAAMLAAGWTQ